VALLLFNDINKTEIVIPDEKSMKRGIEIIISLVEKMTKNSFQIRTLEKLRDTLLPKLMSGEVRCSWRV
jgi:type I restriction enzyme S subunit